ncbi:hypothetical protein HOY80DRAFT_1020321 [Tuber brumale]|nr:hypothetical protein HOY80DRAFT_1020321 [Tuber brumale]
MLRLIRQARISPPTHVHQRIGFRKFGNEFIPDDTEHDNKPNDTAPESVKPKVEPNRGGSQSGLLWDRMNRFDDKIDGAIKDYGGFKVDVTKAIGNLGRELGQAINDLQSEIHQGKSEMQSEIHQVKSEMQSEIHQVKSEIHKEFADIKSDQKVSKWQVHFIFVASSSLVLWTLKDYIQLRFPAFFTKENGTSPKQPEAPQKYEQKK